MRRMLGVLSEDDGADAAREPQPGADDLTTLVERFRAAGLPVRFLATGTPPADPGQQLTVYRIVQEALTNTIRHARAARAEVTLSYEPGFVTVSVTDSGRREEPHRRDGAGRAGPRAPDRNGTPAGRTAPLLAGAGLGLAGIAERVASCGGQLTVGPTPARGFAVRARLPAL